ncbi:hypothetical protein LSAT2_010876 [Lamellibrachia satsuma]|nr:hypothetical protein LSAT2_010876 [Lamellibrachia satsuma]
MPRNNCPSQFPQSKNVTRIIERTSHDVSLDVTNIREAAKCAENIALRRARDENKNESSVNINLKPATRKKTGHQWTATVLRSADHSRQ